MTYKPNKSPNFMILESTFKSDNLHGNISKLAV